ncbi:MAG: hypothetical protein ACJAYC_001374 [Halieaceae bacterium]
MSTLKRAFIFPILKHQRLGLGLGLGLGIIIFFEGDRGKGGGKGYAFQAIELICKYAFVNLNVHQIYAELHDAFHPYHHAQKLLSLQTDFILDKTISGSLSYTLDKNKVKSHCFSE